MSGFSALYCGDRRCHISDGRLSASPPAPLGHRYLPVTSESARRRTFGGTDPGKRAPGYFQPAKLLDEDSPRPGGAAAEQKLAKEMK